MASTKQTRSPSVSFTCSPTVDSLSRLEEGFYLASFPSDQMHEPDLAQHSKCLIHMHVKEPLPLANKRSQGDTYQTFKNHRYHTHIDNWQPHVHAQNPRFTLAQKNVSGRKLPLLLPFVAVIAFSCVYYAHFSSDPEHGLPLSMDMDSFDYVALIFFISVVLVSIRIAYPNVNAIYRFKTVLSQGRDCFTSMYLKPVIKYLDGHKLGKKLMRRASFITWPIGSKAKFERVKDAREVVQVYSNGDVYEGEFHEGRYSGSGVYHFYMSGRYEGDWVDGRYDGFGVETWIRGSRYRGQYTRGLREGYGVYRFYTGDVYSGEWSNGQSHGCGVQTCEDGSRFVGEFRWGVKHGVGYYHFRNGDTYAGEYFADKMHGYGVYNFVNGHRYEGAWHEGKRQGLGIYTFRSGDVQAGYWHEGILGTPSTHNPVVGAVMAISHSKVLHAVQEARQASAKSYKVSHVNQRVNKAVAAANRAANSARVAAMKAVQKKGLSGLPP